MINLLLRIVIIGLVLIGGIYLLFRSLEYLPAYELEKSSESTVLEDGKVPTALDSIKSLKQYAD